MSSRCAPVTPGRTKYAQTLRFTALRLCPALYVCHPTHQPSPPNEASMLFLVTGFKTTGATSTQVAEHYSAATQDALQKYLLAQPWQNGGFTSFSVQEIDVLPESATIVCPNCAHKIVNEHKVTHVPTSLALGSTPPG